MPYRDFYRMQAEAFGSLPVLNLFYSSRTHQDGWRYLLRGIAAREPFLFVAGDYGMGKTMLSMMLARLLKKKDIPLVQITDPHCGFSGILRQTAALLGIATPGLGGEEPLLTAIYDRLGSRESRQAILVIIDDAQELGAEALVRLRAFANFNRDGFFPLQLIFFAHPSFSSLLRDPRLAAMDQRIKRRHRLAPLTLQETREYIYFRLVKSGAPGAPFFDDDAVREIHTATGGIPRLINNICDASLTRGASKLETCITLATVREARSDQAESFMPRVVAPGRSAAPDNGRPFSAPPVHIAARTQLADTEPGPVPEAPVPVRSRKPWMPAAACAGAAAAAACLTVFFFLRFYDPAAPEMPTEHQVTAVPAAALPGTQRSANPALPEKDVSAASGGLAGADVAAAEAMGQAGSLEKPEAAAPAAGQEAASGLAGADVAAAEAMGQAGSLEKPEAAATAAPVPQAAVAGAAQADAPAAGQAAPVPEDLFGGLPTVPDQGRPFTLRLGCYKTAESADAAASVYARRKLAPFVAHVNLQQQGRWWIFYTGSFASREEAERARARIEMPDADIIFMPYACRVGVYASADMDAGLVSAMQQLGCVPYVLANGDGTVSLFAGVYRQRDNAEVLKKALAENNIGSTVVLLRPGTVASPASGPEGAPQVPAS